MKVRVLVPQADFNLFDRVVELHLRVSYTDLADAFGVDENDVLLIADQKPQNKVGVEVAGLEKADAFAAT